MALPKCDRTCTPQQQPTRGTGTCVTGLWEQKRAGVPTGSFTVPKGNHGHLGKASGWKDNQEGWNLAGVAAASLVAASLSYFRFSIALNLAALLMPAAWFPQ